MQGHRGSHALFRWLGLLVAVATAAGLLTLRADAAPRSTSASEFDAPSGLAFGGNRLWVTNEAGNSVTEIDPSSGAWIATLSTTDYGFNRPTALASVEQDLFIANAVGTVSEMRVSDGSWIRTISGPEYRFVNPVAIEGLGNTVLVLSAGHPGARPPVAGSITELDARTGALVRVVSGARLSFRDPVAFTVSGPDVFVVDKGSNSVTEVNSANGRLVRVIARQGLSAPDGIAVGGGHVWVSDSASNAVTVIDRASGVVIATMSNANGDYGFGSPSAAITSAGSIFIASPFGSSPMVTKLSAASGKPSWYMCNTNGPYYFSLLSAFAVQGDHLWVASRSGANSKTPGARTGSLTELSTGNGALIATLPMPQQPVPTTTSTLPTTTTSAPTTTTSLP